MTDLTVALRILADTAGAQGGLRQMAESLRALGVEAEAAAAQGDAAAGRLARTYAEAAARIEARLGDVPAAAASQAQAAQGQIGNLVAQINDVGQMIAAGQSPMLLAVQQGTQIAQVLGPMGAAGALRAFGQAFLGVLNPVNLAVIGLTAGVAVLGQWAMSALAAGRETADLAERLDALAAAVRALEAAGRAADVPVERQIAAYGRLADVLRAALEARRALAEAEARAALDGAVAALELPRLGTGADIAGIAARSAEREAVLAELAAAEARLGAALAEGNRRAAAAARAEIAGLEGALDALAATGAIDDLEARIDALARRLGTGSAEARALVAAMQTLDAARADGPAAVAEAAVRALEALRGVAGGDLGAASEPLRTLAGALSKVAIEAAEAARATGEAGAQGIEALGTAADRTRGRLDELARAQIELATRTMAAPDRAAALAGAEFAAANPLPADATADQRRQWEDARLAATGYARAVAEVRAEIARLAAEDRAAADASLWERRAQIAAVEAAYGRDSAEATVARAAAERDAMDAAMRAAGVSDELRKRLLDAWQAAQGLAGVDLAAPIAAARVEARALAGEIAAVLGAAQAGLGDLDLRLDLARIRERTVGDPVGRAVQSAAVRFEAQNPLPDMSALPDGQREAARAEWARLRAETIARERAIAESEQRALAAERALLGGGARGGGRGGIGLPGDSVQKLQADVQALLAGLATAEAAAAEKVRAGLIGMGEAGEAMAQAKRTAADRLAELIARLDALGPAGQAAAEALRGSLRAIAEEAGRAGDGLRRSLIDSFETSFVDAVTRGKDAMTSFADHVLRELTRAFTQKFITPMIAPLIDGLLGFLPFAAGGVVANGVQAFAAGGVPDTARPVPALSAVADTIQRSPILFPMRDGLGLAAEAGAEAILPVLAGPAGEGVRALAPDGAEAVLRLVRAPGGALAVELPDLEGALARPPATFAAGGVIAAGVARMPAAPGGGAPAGGGVSIVVNNNNPSARVEAEARPADNGMAVEVLIEQIEGALADRAGRGIGGLAAVMAQRHGMGRVGR